MSREFSCISLQSTRALKSLLFVGGLGLSAFAVSPTYAQTSSRQEVVEKIESLEQQLQMLKDELKLSDAVVDEPLKIEEAISIDIEGLYFNVSIPGTNVYAFDGKDTNVDNGSLGDWKRNPFDGYDFGYRVNLNYNFNDSPWSVDASHMGYSASTSATTFIKPGDIGGRYTTIANDDFDDTCPEDGEDCYVKSNREIDISHTKLGGNYDIKLNESVVLDLGAGLQYADLQARFKSKEYEGGSDGNGIETSRVKSSYNGVGPYLEAGVGIDLGSNFLLSARALGGVLFGDSSSSITDHSSDDGDCTDAGVGSCRLDKSGSGTTTVPNYSLSIGVEWNKDITENTSLFLHGGYELHQYFGAVDNSFFSSELEDAPSVSSSSDVIMHGFTAGIGVKYVF